MSDPTPCSWQPFFSAPNGLRAGERRRFQVLLRHGDELLYLPRNERLVLRGLQLYQPQSTRARLAIAACRFCTAFHLPNFGRDVTVSIDRRTPLAHFFTKLAGSDRFPDFAVLPGNPRAPARRFVFLLFDAQGQAAHVVKAAFEVGGCQLIERETSFLRIHGNGNPHLPQVVNHLADDDFAAMALPFYPGKSLGPEDMAVVGVIMSSWLRKGGPMPWTDFPTGRRFLHAAGNACPENLRKRLQEMRLTPTLYHGDFAPWNTRESSEHTITVLDWERGEPIGVPGWDWFHYLVQASILVRKDDPHAIVQRARKLFALPTFQSYARQSGFLTQELPLFAAYLGHAEQVGQTEGFATLRQLKEIVYGLL